MEGAAVDYNKDLERLVREGKSAQDICDRVVLGDIHAAATILCPVCDQTEGRDGYYVGIDELTDLVKAW